MFIFAAMIAAAAADGHGEFCDAACTYQSSWRFIVNSCGDIIGPTVIGKVLNATGTLLSADETKEHYSKTWEYMTSLAPNDVFLLGDNVYNDGIADWARAYHPFGRNYAAVLADASTEFMQYHGYLTEDELAGPLYKSYLQFLEDKLYDGFVDNDEFDELRSATNNGIHMHWDDHDYLTNDPSNPHELRHEFRKAEIDALTGDKEHFRFGVAHKGIERSWTKTLDNNGMPFIVRFIHLDEETTHNGTQGCAYYVDSESETGFKPGLATDASSPCPDLSYVEDFEDPKRDFFGDDQLAWFVEELQKPADLRLVFNGGPNFEIDYSYNSLTDFPGAKRKFVEALRESGAEKIIFFGGDSHATYVTKTPNIVGYPLYTIIGSGQTQGLSYDRYVGFWGDISHRFLVAAGSTAKNNAAASFAEVEIVFDPEPTVRFTPHLADEGETERWGPWFEQGNPNPGELWAARYDILLSELVIDEAWPKYHLDSSLEHKFVTETILLSYFAPENTTDVSLTITNAIGDTLSIALASGFNCGEGYYGFCKDVWGAFAYDTPTSGDYIPSVMNELICEHAGFVGDEIIWSVAASMDGEVIDVVDGTLVLKIRNNVLVYDGYESPEDMHFYNTQARSIDVSATSIGTNVLDVIAEPVLYGNFSVPVKGFDGAAFDDSDVQAAYEDILAVGGNSTVEMRTEFQALYLATYYPTMPSV